MIQKRKEWNSGAVSDIIGNILILGITVVLFSTIFVFVGQMPTPQNVVYVDFDVSFELNQTSGQYTLLNVTHLGGEPLNDFNTQIYITVDGVSHQFLFSDSLYDIGDTWRAGETALFDCSPGSIGGADVQNASSVSLMILSDNEIAWQGDVKRIGNSAPVIMDRWADSDPTTTEKEAVMLDDDFSVYVVIKDADADLNKNSVFVNMSSIGLGSIQMTAIAATEGDTRVSFIANATTPAAIPIGYYYFVINATDTAGHETRARMEVAIGGDIGINPNLVITPENIWIDPANPTRGDDGVRIYVKIINYGKVSTTFTTYVYDIKPDGTQIEVGNVSSTIPAGGPETIYVDWDPADLVPSGNHTVRATAVLPLGVTDADSSDNTGEIYVQVMPKILVVDDDGSSLGSDTDTSSMILAALDSGDFRYDRFVVTSTDGPAYDSGLNKMEDYDIIIWDTGHETTNTLTATDEANLQTFLNAGGKLWLMGEDILNDLGTDSFMQSYIHVTGFVADTGPDALLFGSPGSCLNGTDNVTTAERNNVPNSGDVITTFSTDTGDEAGSALTSFSGGGGNINAIWYDDIDRNSRRIFFPFELAAVEEPAQQAEITYKVLRWLGNISFRYGRDLSIAEQTITPTRPFYSQPVTISAVVRNNGMLPETNVEVVFWIDGMSNGTIKNPDVIQPGESWRVNYTWIPRTVGAHSIVAEVDPYNVIEETNENNNRVSSYLASTDIYIQYRILVVDDDDSANNGGTLTNVTEYATSALESLGYDYELYTIATGDDGPDINTLDDYNAVLWFTGESNATITVADQGNLTSYLDGGGYLWLDGQTVINDLGTANTFVTDYLMVNGATLDSGSQSRVYGQPSDEITHGMNMVSDPIFTDTADVIYPGGGATEILWRDSSRSEALALRYENTLSGSKLVFMTWDISAINGTYVNNTFTNGSIMRENLVYMIMHWFDLPEERVELHAASSDIYLSDVHPQLGDSYVIRATIHNSGGASTSALVRFMDGSTVVGSDSIYIAPGETTTAEVVWTPLYAGMRTITIQIDPIYEISNEIFRFNDNPYIEKYVYFFWDDMENGTGKWQHDSTIMLLNGENALDYFDRTTVLYTDVLQDWDEAASIGLQTTTDTYHSYDSCYWLEEPAGGGATTTRVPMDVVMVIDTSTSMDDDPDGDGNTKLDDAKIAAKNFVGKLNDDDRMALYTFKVGSEDPELSQGYLYMTSANKALMNTTIDNLVANGYTPIWDTIGTAITYSENNQRTGDVYRITMALTDGDDYGNEGREDGSETYCPGSEVGTTYDDCTWGWPTGLRWGDPAADFSDQGGGGDDVYRFGGGGLQDWWGNNYGAWLDLASELRTGLIYAPIPTYTIGLGIDPHEDDPTNPSIGTDYPFTSEYDLWQIAETSNAEYFYAPTSSDLDSIFQTIYNSAYQNATGSNVTRAAAVGPTTLATLWSDGFESGDFSAWDVVSSTTDCQVVSTTDIAGDSRQPYSGIYSASFQDSNAADDYIEKDNIDLTGYGNVHLTFWYHEEDLEPNDHLYVDIYHDGAWDTGVWASPGSNNGDTTTSQAEYAQVDVNISALLATPDQIIRVRFRAPAAWSSAWWDECALDDVAITGTFSDTTPPTIISTVPANGATGVAIDADIVVTFSEPMSTGTVTYTCTPDPGGWSTAWSAGDTVLTLSHSNLFDQNTAYTFQINSGQDLAGNNLAAGAVPNPWTFTTGDASPYIVSTSPADGATGVGLTDNIVITFSEAMNPAVSYTCSPDPGGWAESWDATATILTLSHNAFTDSTTYTFNVTAATDTTGNALDNTLNSVPNPWSFTTIDTTSPYIVSTNPADGDTLVPVNSDVVVTFSEPMDPTSISYTCSPDPGGWSESWDATGTILTLSHSVNFADLTSYTFSIDWANDTSGNLLDNTQNLVPNPWSFTTADSVAPTIISTSPADGATGVGWYDDIVVTFSEPMDPTSVSYTCSPDPGGWSVTWSSGDTVATFQHQAFAALTTYTFEITAATDKGGNALIAGGVPNPWSFTTSQSIPNFNKTAVTQTMDLGYAERAMLTFWHKYNIVPGVNGAILEVGYRDPNVDSDGNGDPTDDWDWKYIIPSQGSYNGNLRLNVTRLDSFGNEIVWAWNGVSGKGEFSWQPVTVNLLKYVPANYTDQVRVKFQYIQYGSGTGYGWYIDDVKVKVSRADSTNVTSGMKDVWQMTENDSWSGTHSWWNGNPADGWMMPGIDNSLISLPVDLVNARTATLSAYFKFNINDESGAPPDGFRVEVSTDNGITWHAINVGVRSSWGVSGTDNSGTTSYTGHNAGNYWVEAGTLTRLNCDLSEWSGNVILIRFRVVTTNGSNYDHYDDNTVGFGGFYIDDVVVSGETVHG